MCIGAFSIVSMLELTIYVSYCNVHAVRRFRISLDGCFLGVFGPLAGELRAGQKFVRMNVYRCLFHCFNLELTIYESYCNVHAVRHLQISLDGCFLGIFGPLAGRLCRGKQYVRMNAYMHLIHCLNA